ncbi:MAG: general stress protein [Pseudomonadota bacterium]
MKDLNSVIGVYDTHDAAETAVRALQRSGFDIKRLSIIGKGYRSEEHPVGFYTTGDRMKTWGGIGAFWGGLWGLLFGGAFYWVPGFGPLAAAGAIASLLAGALEGAVLVGGLSALGAGLVGLGMSKEDAIKYERDLKADRYLLFVHGTQAEVDAARSLLKPVEAVS